MNKTSICLLAAGIALIPAIAVASVPPVRVPEPATAILLLGIAGVGTAAAGLKRFLS